MLDKSIDGALLALRKQIIRGNGEGLAHVEALLQLRGVAMPRVLPAKRPDVARRCAMRLLILEALRDGPKPLRAVVAGVLVARPGLSHQQACVRASQALNRAKVVGLVMRDAGMWGLAR